MKPFLVCHIKGLGLSRGNNKCWHLFLRNLLKTLGQKSSWSGDPRVFKSYALWVIEIDGESSSKPFPKTRKSVTCVEASSG